MLCTAGRLEGVDGRDEVDEDPAPPPHAVNTRQQATVNPPRILEEQRINNSPEEVRPKPNQCSAGHMATFYFGRVHVLIPVRYITWVTCK
jgi:hypothetical protein